MLVPVPPGYTPAETTAIRCVTGGTELETASVFVVTTRLSVHQGSRKPWRPEGPTPHCIRAGTRARARFLVGLARDRFAVGRDSVGPVDDRPIFTRAARELVGLTVARNENVGMRTAKESVSA